MRATQILAILSLLACAPVLAEGARPPQRAAARPAVLDEVLRRVEEVAKRGGRPVVVFDLDSTLFDNRYRTWRLLLEWAEQSGDRAAAARIRALPIAEVVYSLSENMARVGLEGPRAEAAKAYWLAHFFSDRGAEMDWPEAGAVAYVREVHRRGGIVVYLTGRDAPRMATGTTESLRTWGFPVGVPDVVLMLKPEKETKDLTYKRQATAAIEALGTVVAAFDNQPENVLLFAKTWPKATTVWLETNHSPGAPEVPARIPRVKNFLRR